MNLSEPFADLLNVPMDTELIGHKIVTFDVIDSTNTYALDHGENGMVIVADRQTAGRGRQGHTWFSAPGLGLWFTVAFDGLTEGLSFAAVLAVRDAISDRVPVQLKWPNDVLCNGKKICGILVEHRAGRTALGIGINVHHRREDFPPELRNSAGSLESEAGGTWDRSEVLRAVLTHLDRRVILMLNEGIGPVRQEWAETCDIVGRRIQRGDISGVVQEIDMSGALIIDVEGELHTIHSGDITYLETN